jgi:uncharacterized protein
LIAIVDSGPLYAAIDRDEPDHQRCVATLELPGLRRIIPTMVVAEVTYLAGRCLGPAIEASFLSALAALDVQAPSAKDWRRVSELVSQYADLRLGGTDASVIVLAERLNTDLIITLDRRHFAAVRPRHCPAFRLLPE